MFVDMKLLTVLLAISPLVMGQQAGTMTKEVHPPIKWQKCHAGGHCSDVHGGIVLDAEYRWLHNAQGQNCFTGSWNCGDKKTCAQNCALDGANYMSSYGVSTSGDALNLKYVTQHGQGKSVGSRLYLLADEHNYEMFHLLGQEFTFDVDTSQLPCGVNGALYFVSMEKDGGASHPGNKAGPRFGTGYCDAQCPRGMKFINGEANFDKHGVCCAEMDIWEANSMAAAYTAHPCTNKGQLVCTGDCGRTCESGGCGFNSYQQGDKEFYGPGKKVNTKEKLTVVTQFITSDGTANGHLTDIRRFYVQNGKVIANSHSSNGANSLSEKFCQGSGSFNQHGGLKGMGEAIREGMVLTFSLWDDYGGHMLWLDANNAGPCPSNSGDPNVIEKQYANSALMFSNIKVGPINSTFHH